MKSFNALSAVLTYPGAELQAAIPVIREVLHDEGLFGPHRLEGLEQLLASLEADDLYDLQERYVHLFDRSRTLSLNLFEHIHGESRDRGSAMVDLLETYRAGGFDLVGPELPDHVPVLLEYLSTLPLPDARALLADAGPILVVLAERLTRRKTPYASVFEALVALAETIEETDETRALLAEPDDNPDDLEALDAVWAEAQVRFGPDPNAGCPASRDLLARIAAEPAPNAQ